MRKLKLMLFVMILLASSSGCLGKAQSSHELLPVRPYLDVQVQEDGGIRLDKSSTEKLMLYLLELERKVNSLVR